MRSLCGLAPVVSVCMMQLEPWFNSWVPESVFSAGGGRALVAAWYCTALDIEECLAGRGDSEYISLLLMSCMVLRPLFFLRAAS